MTDETGAQHNRRQVDKVMEEQRKVTQRHGADIASLRTDVASLQTGLDNVDKGISRLSYKLDTLGEPNPTNWTGIGSLIVTIIIVFGGVFGFLFNSQTKSMATALDYGSGESQLRHSIQAEQIRYLAEEVDDLAHQLIEAERRQSELNIHFTQQHRK